MLNILHLSNSSDKLKIYMLVPRTRALGPYTRFAIWVQGCPFRCLNCMTPGALSLEGGYAMEVHALAECILNSPAIEGITISGGEPFLQAAALSNLIEQVKKNRNLGVIVYSGFTLKQLLQMAAADGNSSIKIFLDKIDLLIDGLYVESLNDGRSLRGSSNQVVHQLTNRYAEVFQQYYGKPQRRVEIQIQRNEMQIVGIPGHDMLKKWQAKFLAQ